MSHLENLRTLKAAAIALSKRMDDRDAANTATGQIFALIWEATADISETSDQSTSMEDAYRAAAQGQYTSEGELEIDEDATVSISEDGGAYVAAWRWITDEDAGVCKECRGATTDNGEGYDGVCGDCCDIAEQEEEAAEAARLAGEEQAVAL